MVFLIYFIIYLLNIICVNSQDNSFISSLLKKYYPPKIYNKLKEKYNINFQIKDNNNNIIKEFFVNTSYISKEIQFDFFYTGKLFYSNNTNNTNLDLLSMKNHNNNWILLIRSEEIFNNYIKHNKSLIRYLTKAIIIPKNSKIDIKIYAKFCLDEFPLYLIELDEELFNELENKYIEEENNDNKYFITIISKKCELFPYIGLYSIILLISLFLFIFSLLNKCLIKKFEDTLKGRQIKFTKEIQCYLDSKLCILFLLLLELNIFYNTEGFIIEYGTFLKSLIIIFMIINKVQMTYFILNIYSGIGLIFLENNIHKSINFYFNTIMTIFYIIFNIFISPLIVAYSFYSINIMIYTPMTIIITFYTIKNIIFFFKINSKIRKIKRYNNKYGSSIRLKLCIVITQFLMFLIYIFFFFILHKYIYFKKRMLFDIERNILFQCLDSCLILLISLVYIPRKWPYGFGNMIITSKGTKLGSKRIKVSNENYHSSFSIEDLNDEKKIKEFSKNNHQKHFILLNPILFLKKNNENNLLKNNIKVGKLE